MPDEAVAHGQETVLPSAGGATGVWDILHAMDREPWARDGESCNVCRIWFDALLKFPCHRSFQVGMSFFPGTELQYFHASVVGRLWIEMPTVLVFNGVRDRACAHCYYAYIKGFLNKRDRRELFNVSADCECDWLSLRDSPEGSPTFQKSPATSGAKNGEKCSWSLVGMWPTDLRGYDIIQCL